MLVLKDKILVRPIMITVSIGINYKMRAMQLICGPLIHN